MRLRHGQLLSFTPTPVNESTDVSVRYTRPDDLGRVEELGPYVQVGWAVVVVGDDGDTDLQPVVLVPYSSEDERRATHTMASVLDVVRLLGPDAIYESFTIELRGRRVWG